MSSKQTNKVAFSKVLFIGVVILALLFIAYSYVNKQQPSTQSFSTKAQLTPNEFISLFDVDNTNQAEDYIDEALEIKGILQKITYRNHKYTLFIKSDMEGRFIMCEMQDDQIEVVKEIKENEIVTVKGIFKGVLLDAILLNCIIINEAL